MFIISTINYTQDIIPPSLPSNFRGMGGNDIVRLYWDGRNNVGQAVSGGIYFYKLKTGDFTQTRKMVLLK